MKHFARVSENEKEGAASPAGRGEAAISFREYYEKVAIPFLREKLGRTNVLSLPRVDHVVVASGVGKHAKEGKFLENVEKGLTLLTGQKPVQTLARKSVAGFKLREGQVAGFMVTLRGARMEEFLHRLIHVVLPRVRDFRGISAGSIDANGNLTIGIRETHAFPEVEPQSIETIFGIQVSLITTTRSREEARTLFESLGFPLTEHAPERVGSTGPRKKRVRTFRNS